MAALEIREITVAPDIHSIVLHPGMDAIRLGPGVTEQIVGRTLYRITRGKPVLVDGEPLADWELDLLRDPVFPPVETLTFKRQEQPTMKRNDFTFAFKGRDIAAAIDDRIAELDEKRGQLDCVFDEDTLRELGDVLGAMSDCCRLIELRSARIKSIDYEISQWQLERVGYATHPTQAFELDAEDIRHFGLTCD